MSKTKRRKNLKGKLIGCLCLAVIAAGMTTSPVIPCISSVGVITASAENTAAVEVDLSKIIEYKDGIACPTGVTAVYANDNHTIELTLDSGSYKFSGSNSINNSYVDVKIIVPLGKNVQIEFDNAAIINDYGQYADTNIFATYNPYSVYSFGDECHIYDYAVPFKVEGTLTVSGSLSVDTHSYYDTCWLGNKHGASADLYEGGGTFNKGDFLTIKYVDEDGIVIDRKYYLNGDKSKVEAGYSCLTDPDTDNVVTARESHVLTYHKAVAPDCTTDGTVEYWECSECGKFFSDNQALNEITAEDFTIAAHHTVDPLAAWESDNDDNHYHICSVCSDKADVTPHSYDSGVITTPATETTEGVKTYTCSVCNHTKTETVPKLSHTHSLSEDYSKDETGHWHTCSGCDEKVDFGAHTEDSGTVTVQPTAYTTGVRVYSCSVCGYVLRTETIPATGMPSHPTYPTYPTYTTYPVVSTPSVFAEKLTVKAELDGGTATLSWDKVENADKYYVYQYKDGKYVEIKTTTDTSVTFKGLKNGKTYKFLVRYSIGGKLSPMTCSDKITVKVYYKPIAKATSTENSIKLTWRAVPNAEKYAVYKYVDGKAVKLCETEKLAVRINKLTPDTKYQYIVRAYVDGKWTSMKKSDIVTFKTKAE